MNLTTTVSAIALVAGALSPLSLGPTATGQFGLNASATVSVSAVPFASSAFEGETHCVGEARPLEWAGAGVEVVPQIAPEPVCFATVEEAATYLDRVTQSASRDATAMSSVVIGTVYSDANYGGSTYTLYGTGTCSGVTYGFSSLTGGWDSIISSAKAASGCWVTLYKATNYGGEKLNCTPGCPSIGSLNDQVRSIVFRPQGTVG